MTDMQRLNLIQRAMQGKLSTPQPAREARSEIGNSFPEVVVHGAPAAAANIPHTGFRSAEVTLNYAALREAKIALPGDRNSVTFNEFRSIKRKLLPLAAQPRNEHRSQNVVMVSSALPGEGKTFTSINLAIALAAEKNLNVILVDGDVIRSSVSRYFEGASSAGLLDLFTKPTANIDELLHPCKELPNLRVLFSGSHNDSAPEMFASSRMGEICDRLSKRFPDCIVVIDSPPVLSTSEPTSLVTHVDHLIMVVGAGRSSRHQVESAISALSSCRSIFLLLNKAPKWQRPAHSSYYYYPTGT